MSKDFKYRESEELCGYTVRVSCCIGKNNDWECWDTFDVYESNKTSCFDIIKRGGWKKIKDKWFCPYCVNKNYYKIRNN